MPLAVELVVVKVADEAVGEVGKGEEAFESATLIVTDGVLAVEHHYDVAGDEEIDALGGAFEDVLAKIDGDRSVVLDLETVAPHKMLEEKAVVVDDEGAAIGVVESHADARKIIQEHPAPIVADAWIGGISSKGPLLQQPLNNGIFTGGHSYRELQDETISEGASLEITSKSPKS